MYPIIRLFLFGLLSVFLFSGCGEEADAPAERPATTLPAQRPVDPNAKPVPRFDADSAYAYVAKQVSFGPRVMNTPAHDATREWLVGKLRSFGAEVEEQKFTATAYDGTPLRSTNIIGRYNPDMEDRIVLAAHWDTRHVADSDLEQDPDAVVEGADDGASGVGVLLEIARQLGMSTPSIGVDIIFFDAEDYGESKGGSAESWGLGSQYYSKNLRGTRPRYGILLDMVGAKDARFYQEEISLGLARNVVEKVWGVAQRIPGYAVYFPLQKQRPVTDDHYFVNTMAGYPMANIINFREETQTGFVAHWHTGNDGMEIIDKQTLQAVGQVVTAVVYKEAAGTI